MKIVGPTTNTNSGEHHRQHHVDVRQPLNAPATPDTADSTNATVRTVMMTTSTVLPVSLMPADDVQPAADLQRAEPE